MTEITGEALSSTQERTREAILDAAVRVIATGTSASMGQVAAEARVSRSTLHRYFPERSDLVTAIGNRIDEASDAAVRRARPEEGDPLDALLRVGEEYFDISALFRCWVVLNPDPFEEPEGADRLGCSDQDRRLIAVLERGQRVGSIDPDLSPLWYLNIMWAILYASWEAEQSTGGAISRAQARASCRLTLRKLLVAPGA